MRCTKGRATLLWGKGLCRAVPSLSLLLLFSISPDASAAFQPDGTGLVSMEAEHFSGKQARGGHDWQREVKPNNGFSGEGTLRALPEDKLSIETNYTADSPRLDYQVEFANAGTHYIWVRGRGPGGGSNSVHAGLNGQELASAAGISVPASSSYGWNSGSFIVSTSGVHTVNVWMRESGTIIDKLVITPDADFTPTGTGPPQSPQGGLPTVATPVVTPAGGTFTDSITIALATTTADAVIYYTLNGSDPNASSILYSAPFTLTESATLKAIGIRGDYHNSAIASADFTITPTGNTPPSLNPIGNKSIAGGQTLRFTVTASDPDAPPALSVSGLPSGASFNSSTGVFNWTPPADASAASPYTVTFTATDAADTRLTDSKTISITVTTAGGDGQNIPPAPVQGCSTVPQAGTLTGRLRAIDSDNSPNELIFSLDSSTPNYAGPVTTAHGAEVSLIDTTTGAFVYTPNASGPRGMDSFEFRVDDPEGFSLGQETVIIKPAIMPLGDSITQGTINGKDPSAERVGYRRKLFNDLTASGFGVDFVGSLRNGQSARPAIRDPDHEGWGGFKASQIANGKTSGGVTVFPGVYGALNMNPADVVLLHIGTNNINQNVPASTATDIEQILDEIDRWEVSNGGNPVTVFLAKIIDRSNAQCNLDGCSNPKVVELNKRIAQIAASRARLGDDIVLVDQYSALDYPEDMAPQGTGGSQLIHPDQNGYEKMARPWLNAIMASGKLPKCQ
ncbi:MAG: chitobiase/beta-hexosaminidase C-terminal domain-containing protein [Gammaproteobacteria bacterium]